MEKNIIKLNKQIFLSYVVSIFLFGPIFYFTSILFSKDLVERAAYVTTFLLFIVTLVIFVSYFHYIKKIREIDSGAVYAKNTKYIQTGILFLIAIFGQVSFLYTESYIFAVLVLILLPEIINILYNSRILIGKNYIVKGFDVGYLCSLKSLKSDNEKGIFEFHDRKPMKLKMDKESLDFINLMLEERNFFQNLCCKYGIGNKA